MQEHSLVSIAEELNYCRCHISRVKSRALKKLRKMLENTDESTSAKEMLAAHKKSSYKGGRGRRKVGENLAHADLLQEALQGMV